MKKLTLITTSLLAAASVFAQGTVDFNTLGDGTKIISWGVGPNIGSPIAGGEGVVAGLYHNGQLLTPTENVGDVVPGVVFPLVNSLRTVAGIGPSVEATFTVRAWDTSTGADYDTATVRGESAPFTTTGLGGVPPVGPPITAPIVGDFMQSFAIVPEPSVIALGVLGAGALLLLRRRK